ncbi:fructose-bisphosphate aldolase class I [Mucilaginibacter yixingensis]|uniref:Probable fructose-bisphosphate aldolase class 1 n=1 Tax=Mucilaginibacter yixingensis TaxID=1295612 RepID=A0A2T5JB80_9SPHI|nr:class I fructose-bisphosphate aldolase [Mucilaginibacter yixingensis]PTQ98128.1 fructose-bisphosphate aldolase class I [Mucilaginibacter yixingensis]
MDINLLKGTVSRMLADDKGLLAMDESIPTANKRFKALGIPETEEYRRKYRQLIVTTQGLEEYISGAILFDETIHQQTDDGRSMLAILKEKGIVPGIKVDQGTVDLPGFPGEKITEGLDGLATRLANYAKQGLLFAKWRAVITIGNDIPTPMGIKANAFVLARYAALCQQVGLVPIVEPEVLMDGSHTLQRCAEVTEQVLHAVFAALHHMKVVLDGIILKPNMVLPGKDCPVQDDLEAVADATIQCFMRSVPAAVPGIAFLSGGQSAQLATERLNTMHIGYPDMPWALTFSFSRAIQQPALDKWAGKDENVAAAQQLLYERAGLNAEARQGSYMPVIEK